MKFDEGQKIFLTRGTQGHVYSTVALRLYQEDRGAERSKSTPDYVHASYPNNSTIFCHTLYFDNYGFDKVSSACQASYVGVEEYCSGALPQPLKQNN